MKIWATEYGLTKEAEERMVNTHISFGNLRPKFTVTVRIIDENRPLSSYCTTHHFENLLSAMAYARKEEKESYIVILYKDFYGPRHSWDWERCEWAYIVRTTCRLGLAPPTWR